MQADFPLHDSAEEATDFAIKKAGGKYKQVAGLLYPHLKPASAYAALKNALNPAKPEKLTFDQHLLVARHLEVFDVLFYACMETGHERPRAVNRAEQVATLQQQFIASVQLQQSIAERLARYDDAPDLRVAS